MRHYLLPSLGALTLLLALVVPPAFVTEAARPARASLSNKISAADSGRADEAAARVRAGYGRLPLSFEPNRGQAAPRVRFLARNDAYSLYLTADEMALAPRGAAASALRIKLLGANPRPRSYGLDELEGKSNYLAGRDPSRWRTDVPNYGRVKYEGVYAGVDVVYYGTERQLEYDFNLAPGADAGLIRLRVEGASKVRVDEGGDLVLSTPAGEVRQRAPRAFQEVEGARREVSCRYVRRGAALYGFELGDYDRARPLVIDPVLAYSTYLGGTAYDEGTSVAVDAQGNAYVTGHTSSFDFPVTPGAAQRVNRSSSTTHDSYDAFVVKLNASGTARLYSTYLGGNADDRGTSIAVDASGQAHVAGETRSTNFPVTAGAFRTTRTGVSDVFVSKLNAAGSALVYSTYLGGGGEEDNARLALDGAGAIYVGGRTHSADFPVTPGAFQPQPNAPAWNAAEGFVTKLSPTAGAGLLFSTYLGGSGDDFVDGLAAGPDGSAYATGRTASLNFPVTPGSFQPAHAADGSAYDAFVTRLSADGTRAVYSTFYGGDGYDYSAAVAVDADGAAYFGGQTSSRNMLTTPGALRTTYVGAAAAENDYDAFVAKLDPAGGRILYATYFGGNGADRVNALAVDAQGNAYLAGETNSTDLPVGARGVQPNFGGGYFDGFFVELDAAASAVVYGTYLGGGNWEQAKGVALDYAGDVYLAGNTYSFDFVTTPSAAQPAYGGAAEAFVAKLALGVQDYSVGGRVTNEHGSGLRDVEVIVGGDVSRTVLTDADGYYRVNGLPAAGSVTVRARRFNFLFDPPEGVTLSNVQQDETVNFTGAAPLVITGHVLDEENGYGAYVPVTLASEGGTLTNYTGFDGMYAFVVPSGGDYTVTPGPDPEYTFAPQSRSVANLTGDLTLDFTAQRTPRISGRVADEYGYGLADVRVTLGGPALSQPLVQTTDAYGYFRFDALERGASYTVTPSDPATNRSFSPAAQTVVATGLMQFVDFTALQPLAIHGRVTDPDGNPVTGVATLTGAVNAETQVDEWGSFNFMNLPRGGAYTVTVTKPGSLYTFSPPSQSVADLQTFQFFEFTALPPLRIMGRVADANFNGLRATVTLGGTVNATTQANEYGEYSFENLPRGGAYTVTPSYPLYTFAPESRGVTDAQDNQFFMFEALPPLRIRGGVADEDWNAMPGVTVTLSGTVNAAATTDENGVYSFENLPRGGTYTVTPAHELYNFTPPSFQLDALNEDAVVPPLRGALRRFKLSGRVADAAAAPLPGVTLTLGGAGAGTTQTDAGGNYVFDDLVVGRAYTVAAARPGYAFTPAAVNVTDPRGDRTANFSGSHLTYTLSGRVTEGAGGAGLAGVTLSLGGSLSATAQTDAQGNYSFAGLPSEGSYAVTPARANFFFEPVARSFDNLLADASADFAGSRVNYQIGGRVTDGAGAALPGVTVTLGGAASATAQTDAAGRYAFAALPSGFDYTLTASKTHYTFSPQTRQVDGLAGDTTADFTGALVTRNIGGRVAEGAGGVAGVTVTLGGTRAATAQTDAAGNYLFTGLPANGTYTVTPSHAFYSFAPGGASFNTLPSNQTANFAAARLLYQVGGYALDPCGRAIGGVTMSLTHDGVAAAAQTDAAGFYMFAGVQAGYNYTLAPAGSAYTFSPPSFAFPGLDANQAANFTGRPPTTTADVFALADLYVRGGSATTNFGAATQLVTRLANQSKDTYETYLKFDAGRPCTVASVRLRLYGQLSSSGTMPVSVYAVPTTTWTETATNWNNRPTAGTLLRTVNVTGTAAAWYEWDVTDYVRAELAAGRGVVSFVLKSAATTNYQATFNSREAAGANAPRLTLTTP
jgi:hypothetical protein